MRAYSEAYLGDVVENQGKLFDYVAQTFPETDTEDFINKYMSSRTRKCIDNAMAYVNTMDAKELWKYFTDNEDYKMKKVRHLADLCRTGLANSMLIISGITIYQVQKSCRKFQLISLKKRITVCTIWSST